MARHEIETVRLPQSANHTSKCMVIIWKQRNYAFLAISETFCLNWLAQLLVAVPCRDWHLVAMAGEFSRCLKASSG